MRKLIILFVLFALCCAGALFADDYKIDFISALNKNDFAAAESIVNKNIGTIPIQERRHMLNLSLTYSRSNTALRVLELFKKYNVVPGNFDLYTAIDNNQNDEVIKYILNSGAQANGEILLLAMEKQRYDFAKQFIQSGTDVNYHYPPGKEYTDGMTCLLHASKNNNLELIKMLVDRGAFLDAKNKDGNTALSLAQSNGNTQIIDFLIESGASQNAGNVVRPQSQNQSGAQAMPGGGIGSFLDSQLKEFQPGKYRLSRGNRDLQFTGTENYGNVSFMRNDRVYSGTYQISGTNIIVILEGRTFIYSLDSNSSFSGNGETWARVGN